MALRHTPRLSWPMRRSTRRHPKPDRRRALELLVDHLFRGVLCLFEDLEEICPLLLRIENKKAPPKRGLVEEQFWGHRCYY